MKKSRTNGQFKVRVLGPTNQVVTLDRFSSVDSYWTNHATFTNSAEGDFDYTDTAATNTHCFYRCQIGSLKSCNAVGYVDVAMPAGYSMIANPLEAVDNRVCALLPNMPNGTNTNYTYTNGSWLSDFFGLALMRHLDSVSER